jgi:hypothetical protein
MHDATIIKKSVSISDTVLVGLSFQKSVFVLSFVVCIGSMISSYFPHVCSCHFYHCCLWSLDNKGNDNFLSRDSVLQNRGPRPICIFQLFLTSLRDVGRTAVPAFSGSSNSIFILLDLEYELQSFETSVFTTWQDTIS